MISCDLAETDDITAHLGLQPSEIRECRGHRHHSDGTTTELLWHIWEFASPLSAQAGDPTARLCALVEHLRPFGDRLSTLDAKHKPWIDITYWVMAPRSSYMAAKFDWFCVPPSIMKTLGDWNISLSYEVFWYNHADWKSAPRPWWSRLWRWPQ